jgi:hypothetical protein
MTEQEVRETMKSYGWSFLRRERRSRSYVYAARKVRAKRVEVYIGSFTALAQLTLDQLITKLGIVVQPSETTQCYPLAPATDQRAAPVQFVPLTMKHTRLVEGIIA